MLTSFFGKSSPLNFVLVSSYVLILGGLHYALEEKPGFTLLEISTVLGVIAVLIFSMLLLDFTIRKNSLTPLHTFGIFVFSCSVTMLPVLFFQLNLALAGLFLLLAYRRMFSLRSPKNTEVKILDASIWIGVASLFYFWCILAFFPLFAAIFMMPWKSFRFYLIPFLGVLGLLLISAAYQFVVFNSLESFARWPRKISFDFSAYASWELLIASSFFLALLVWTLFSSIADITKGPRKRRPNKVLQLYLMGTSLLIIILTNEKAGAELLFLMPPFALIVAGYVQKKQDLWFKETLLWCFLLLPIVILFV